MTTEVNFPFSAKMADLAKSYTGKMQVGQIIALEDPAYQPILKAFFKNHLGTVVRQLQNYLDPRTEALRRNDFGQLLGASWSFDQKGHQNMILEPYTPPAMPTFVPLTSPVIMPPAVGYGSYATNPQPSGQPSLLSEPPLTTSIYDPNNNNNPMHGNPPDKLAKQDNKDKSSLVDMVATALRRRAVTERIENWDQNMEDLYNAMNLAAVVSVEVDKDSLELINAVMDLTMYEGFEPTSFWSKFTKMHISRKTVKTPAELLDDMMIIIGFYLNRGSKIGTDKIKAKTDKEAFAVLETLKTKYNILDRPSTNDGNNRSYRPTDVTIPRLIACLAPLTAKIISRGAGRAIGSRPPALPRFYAFPAGASLIPTTWKGMLIAWMKWSTNFNDIVNAQVKISNRPPLKNVFTYGMIAHRSQVLSDKDRINLYKELQDAEGANFSGRIGLNPNFDMTEDDKMFAEWLETTDQKKGSDYDAHRKMKLKEEAEVPGKNPRTTQKNEEGDVEAIGY